MLGTQALRARIGYMPQIGRFPDNMRIGEVFDLMKELRRNFGSQHDEELVEAFEIGAIAPTNGCTHSLAERGRK